jgi:ABC-type sugar transport system, permease component
MPERRVRRTVVATTFVVAWSVYMAPLLWLFLTAFKNRVDAVAMPPRFLFAPTLAHFRTVFVDREFGSALAHSIVVAVTSASLVTLLALLSAYGAIKLPARARDRVFFTALTTRMVPPVALVVPLYVLFRQVHLLDSMTAVILVHTAASLGFAIWTIGGYLGDVPGRLREIAAIDGLGEMRFIVTILVPFVLPGLLATAVFTFLFSWNEYLFASILSAFDAQTVPVGIPGLVSHYGTTWEQVAAVAVLSVIPALVLAALSARPLTRMLSFGIVHEIR